MQTKEQARSSFALRHITETFHDKLDANTANFIVGLPTMILTCGIGQSIAFLLSKQKEDKHKQAFTILKEWLSTEVPAVKAATNIEFLKNFTKLDASQYLTAQQEAIAMLQWLKRYARAFEA